MFCSRISICKCAVQVSCHHKTKPTTDAKFLYRHNTQIFVVTCKNNISSHLQSEIDLKLMFRLLILTWKFPIKYRKLTDIIWSVKTKDSHHSSFEYFGSVRIRCKPNNIYKTMLHNGQFVIETWLLKVLTYHWLFSFKLEVSIK